MILGIAGNTKHTHTPPENTESHSSEKEKISDEDTQNRKKHSLTQYTNELNVSNYQN